jgi:hypothetical protein
MSKVSLENNTLLYKDGFPKIYFKKVIIREGDNLFSNNGVTKLNALLAGSKPLNNDYIR